MHKTLLASTVTFLSACAPGAEVHQPTLDEVSAEADGSLELVDRSAILAGAVENEEGPALDLGDPPDGFTMDIHSQDLQQMGETTEGGPVPGGYGNVIAGVAGLVAADVTTALVVGPPAAAIGVALNGELTEHEPWLWSATNTVTAANGTQVTADLNAAWVGVGWLAEMRITSSDETYDDTLWFNGFLGFDGGVGWWDLYKDGEVAGVVEWVADGQGHGEFAIAALQGEPAGDVLGYLWSDGGGLVSHYDASADFSQHVMFDSDTSGEVLLANYNDGQLSCWDENKQNVACE